MSRSLLLLQACLMAPLTVIGGWAVNNLPAADKLNLIIAPWQLLMAALAASLALTILSTLFQESSSELGTQASNLAWESCLIPLLASGGLFFLVQHDKVPATMEAACLYASLGLFVMAAVLPPALAFLRTLFSGGITSSLTKTQVFESPEAEQKVRQNFLEVVQGEIKDRLNTAFHNRVRLNLDKEKRLAEVQRPWDLEVKLSKTDLIPLANGTSIVSVFDQPEVGERLLILGKPGAGKTTTLLELADTLVLRAQENDDIPIPVLLNLASWNSKVPFPDWIVTQLRLKYGLRNIVGRKWFHQAQFLLLLDGLDEVAPELQNVCLQTLNQFQQDYALKRLVICSRIEEYQQLTEQLQLNSAICLKSLRPEQIQEYLLRAVGLELWQEIQNNTGLMDLATTPFFLDVIALLGVESLKSAELFGARQELRSQLLDAYVKQRLKNAPNVSKETLRWLSWLAKTMQKQQLDEFFIEELQPKWVFNTSQLRSYKFFTRLSFALGVALIGGLISGLVVALFFGLISGLISGLAVALLLGLTVRLKGDLEAIFLVEATRWSWSQALDALVFTLCAVLFLGLLLGAIGGLVVGLNAGLITALFFGLIASLISGLIVGLTFGLIFGLIVGLCSGLITPDVKARTFPNQGIWLSQFNALVRGLIFGLIFSLIGGLVAGLLSEPMGGLLFGLITGLFLGLTFALDGGGEACIKHFLLRILLQHWKYAPWNYAKFLNYATNDLLFLQRVGGGYRFVHVLLREYFAECWIDVS